MEGSDVEGPDGGRAAGTEAVTEAGIDAGTIAGNALVALLWAELRPPLPAACPAGTGCFEIAELAAGRASFT